MHGRLVNHTNTLLFLHRVLRQIFKSFKPIIHVLFLLIFFIVIFSIFGKLNTVRFEAYQCAYLAIAGYLIFAQAEPDVSSE
jgi:hypothetical protein